MMFLNLNLISATFIPLGMPDNQLQACIGRICRENVALQQRQKIGQGFARTCKRRGNNRSQIHQNRAVNHTSGKCPSVMNGATLILHLLMAPLNSLNHFLVALLMPPDWSATTEQLPWKSKKMCIMKPPLRLAWSEAQSLCNLRKAPYTNERSLAKCKAQMMELHLYVLPSTWQCHCLHQKINVVT